MPRWPAVSPSGAISDLARARAIERHLRVDYGYTLATSRPEVADPLAYFLFVRRKGHCEYFASSMAVMLRTLGIPSRMATGFQSGVYNPVTDLWLIRASDAHSWVEAWIPGYGWTTFDPTPPDPKPAPSACSPAPALYLDAAETFWQQWVVSYDLRARARWRTASSRAHAAPACAGTRRLPLCARLGALLRRCGAPLRVAGLIWVAALVAGDFGRAAVPPFAIRRRVERVRRGEASVADATVLYLRMLRILKRRGYQKPPWFTPAEFAASLPRTPLGTRWPNSRRPTTPCASAAMPAPRPNCPSCSTADWSAQ